VRATDSDKVVACRRRGKVKNSVLTGDRVLFTELPNGDGVIETVLPRSNELGRPHIANVSLAIIVMATAEPGPDLFLLDKLLWLVLQQGITPGILLTKADLPEAASVQTIRSYYAPHFEVLECSAVTGQGLEQVRARVQEEIAVLTGLSGVGKSSLLNALWGEGRLRTQTISARLQRGRHTTRHVALYSIPPDGWIADSPGFSALEMPAVDRLEVARYFPDFWPYAEECRFHNCLHDKDQDCAVIEAVQAGSVLASRHEHYRAILNEILQKERRY
jgi:ribosome biogenesis GTPase